MALPKVAKYPQGTYLGGLPLLHTTLPGGIQEPRSQLEAGKMRENRRNEQSGKSFWLGHIDYQSRGWNGYQGNSDQTRYGHR